MYAVRLSIAPSTTTANPATVNLDISPGIARRVRVVMPSGCADLVGVWITYRSSRVWPINDDGYFLGNGSEVEFFPNLPLLDPPFLLQINGYNSDDTYTHSPAVYIEIEFTGSNRDRERGIVASLFGQLGVYSEE